MSTGPTGTSPTDTGPTGINPAILAMFPSAGTGTVEPPHIATIDELIASREATILQENTDRDSLAPLLNPSREIFRPCLLYTSPSPRD